MKLRDYLAQHKETQDEFSKRSGLPQTTIAAIATGGGTRAKTARVIIQVTGGLVSLDDLVGEGSEELEEAS